MTTNAAMDDNIQLSQPLVADKDQDLERHLASCDLILLPDQDPGPLHDAGFDTVPESESKSESTPSPGVPSRAFCTRPPA